MNNRERPGDVMADSPDYIGEVLPSSENPTEDLTYPENTRTAHEILEILHKNDCSEQLTIHDVHQLIDSGYSWAVLAYINRFTGVDHNKLTHKIIKEKSRQQYEQSVRQTAEVAAIAISLCMKNQKER